MPHQRKAKDNRMEKNRMKPISIPNEHTDLESSFLLEYLCAYYNVPVPRHSVWGTVTRDEEASASYHTSEGIFGGDSFISLLLNSSRSQYNTWIILHEFAHHLLFCLDFREARADPHGPSFCYLLASIVQELDLRFDAMLYEYYAVSQYMFGHLGDRVKFFCTPDEEDR